MRRRRLANVIPMDDEEFIKQYGEDANLDTISILVKKAYLKMHEARRQMQKNPNICEDDAKKMTTSIEPFSDEMREVLVAMIIA